MLSVIQCVSLVSFMCAANGLEARQKDVNELEFYNEEEDLKVDWSEIPPSSVQAMTRRIDRVCQIIKHMDDTVAEVLTYLIEEEGEHVIDNMRVYCMALNNLSEFIDGYTNLTVHFGRSLLDRGPPKWTPVFFEPKMTFSRFNWTQNEVDQMFDLIEQGKKAYNSFAIKLKEKIP